MGYEEEAIQVYKRRMRETEKMTINIFRDHFADSTRSKTEQLNIIRSIHRFVCESSTSL
jgi:hypothetical protein